MTAKEMFEKLGYDQTKTSFGIWYLDDSNNGFYFNIKGHLELLSHRTINIEELQAINKQVEELQWNK